MPSGIIPDVIAADIAQRYPSQQPYKIEKEIGGYEIDIPGYDLYYSSAGKFIRAEIDRKSYPALTLIQSYIICKSPIRLEKAGWGISVYLLFQEIHLHNGCISVFQCLEEVILSITFIPDISSGYRSCRIL